MDLKSTADNFTNMVMDVSILLLECSTTLADTLRRKGFDVVSGSIGLPDGKQILPNPIYEYEVIIYNPASEVSPYHEDQEQQPVQPQISPRSPLEHMMDAAFQAELNSINRLASYTPDALRELQPLAGHIQRGATLLLFVNHVVDDLRVLNSIYSWIPEMPTIAATRDSKPAIVTLSKFDRYDPQENLYIDALAEVSPLLKAEDLKLPVLQKLVFETVPSGLLLPLIHNKQDDCLGYYLKVAGGRIIALPEFYDNESVIDDFLNRLLPKFYRGGIQRDIVDEFNSPKQRIINEELETLRSEEKALKDRFEDTQIRLATAEREKKRTITGDETARMIIAYYNQAIQDEDRALFYLYKIIDALKNKLGGETAAKQKLGIDSEWRLIGKIANASYGDIRHAPKPADKIKQWSKDEIAECFSAAETIIAAYFSALF